MTKDDGRDFLELRGIRRLKQVTRDSLVHDGYGNLAVEDIQGAVRITMSHHEKGLELTPAGARFIAGLLLDSARRAEGEKP